MAVILAMSQLRKHTMLDEDVLVRNKLLIFCDVVLRMLQNSIWLLGIL